MNIDEYVKEVKKGLKDLDEKTIKEEIDKLKLTIEEKKKNGVCEEEILKDLGNSEDYVKKILNDQKKGFLKRKFKSFIDSLNKLIEIMKENDFNANLKIISDLIILLILLIFIKVPFILVRTLIDSLFAVIGFSLGYDIIEVVVEFLYLIVAFMIFINVFPKWFKGLKSSHKKVEEKKKEEEVKEVKTIGKDLTSISLSDIEEEKTK